MNKRRSIHFIRKNGIKANYLIVILIALMFSATAIVALADFLGILNSLTGSESRADSFAMSWYEDALFFSLVGALGLYISLRNPQDEHIAQRIQWLVNSDHVQSNQDSQRMITREIIKNGAINSEIHYIITVGEYRRDIDAYKVFITVAAVVRNAFADYDNNESMGRAFAEADIVSDDPQMIIGEATMLRCDGDHNELIRTPNKLTNGNPRFEHRFPLPLTKNGLREYEFRFWIFVKRGEFHKVMSERYTERLHIEIHNKTGAELLVSNPMVGYTSPDEKIALQTRRIAADADESMYDAPVESRSPVAIYWPQTQVPTPLSTN